MYFSVFANIRHADFRPYFFFRSYIFSFTNFSVRAYFRLADFRPGNFPSVYHNEFEKTPNPSGAMTSSHLNPRPCTPNFITRTCGGGGDKTPTRFEINGRGACEKQKQRIALDEYSRLVVRYFVLGQYLSHFWGSKVKFS